MPRKKRLPRTHPHVDGTGSASRRPWRLQRWLLLGGTAAGVLLLLIVGLLIPRGQRYEVASQPAPPPQAYQPATDEAAFVGRAVCSTCHSEQERRWHGSHHDLAMQVANQQTVLGNFENATFTHRDVTTTFFQHNGQFFVRTEGPDGQLHDYEVAYTFWVTPLQQYLIAFPGGRYQALGIAWARPPQASGGPRRVQLLP